MGEESTRACRKLTLGAKYNESLLISQVGDQEMEKTSNPFSSRPWGAAAVLAHSAAR